MPWKIRAHTHILYIQVHGCYYFGKVSETSKMLEFLRDNFNYKIWWVFITLEITLENQTQASSRRQQKIGPRKISPKRILRKSWEISIISIECRTPTLMWYQVSHHHRCWVQRGSTTWAVLSVAPPLVRSTKGLHH